MNKTLDFSELLITKLCHDLAAPLGAVYNGVEFLEDVNSEEMRQKALSLIMANSKIATSRLKFFRYIYGKSDNNGESDLQELKQLTEEYFDSQKFVVSWETEITGDKYIQLTHRFAKLMLLLVYMASDHLIHGGEIQVKIKKRDHGKYICVTGKGEKIKNSEDIAKVLESHDFKDLKVGNVVIHLASRLISSLNASIKSKFMPNSFTFEVEVN